MTRRRTIPTATGITRNATFGRSPEMPARLASAFVKMAGNACAAQVFSISDITELHKRAFTPTRCGTTETDAVDSESGFLATK